MPIRFSTPPIESDNAVHQGLEEIAQTHAKGIAPEAAGGAIDPTSVTLPHLVYSARLDDLRNGKGIASAKPHGWRYFLGSQGGRAAEVSLGGAAHGYTFQGLNTGQLNDAMQRLLQSVQSDPRVQANDFECRLLQANALNLAAIWLKNKGDGDDLLVPLNSIAPQLQAGRLYTAKEFNDLLATAARAKRDLEPESPPTQMRTR